MSRRLVASSLVVLAVLGGLGAAMFTFVASADEPPVTKPTIKKAKASSLVLGTSGTKRVTFSTTVTDDSGIKGVKALTWPESSHLDPKAKEMKHVDSAVCKASTATTSVCTYTYAIDVAKDAADSPPGTWYAAVLVTAKDGDTAFSPKASTYTVER
jgi:hypothetical protein